LSSVANGSIELPAGTCAAAVPRFPARLAEQEQPRSWRVAVDLQSVDRCHRHLRWMALWKRRRLARTMSPWTRPRIFSAGPSGPFSPCSP